MTKQNGTALPRRYRVYLRTVASTSIEVEATSEEEAIETAYENTPHLCARCSGWGNDAGIELGEWETLDQPWPASPADVTVEAVDV